MTSRIFFTVLFCVAIGLNKLSAQEPFIYEGGLYGLYSLISKNLNYPPDDRRRGLEGQVIMKVRIRDDHSIDSISVLNSVSEAIDQEAIRVLKLSSGNWTVKTTDYYIMPLKFELSFPGRVEDESIRKSILKYVNKGDYSKALKFLNEWRRRNPFDYENFDLLIKAYSELGDTTNADRYISYLEQIKYYQKNLKQIGYISKEEK